MPTNTGISSMLNKHLAQGTILILSQCFSVFVYEIKINYCLISDTIWIDFIGHQTIFITSSLINFNELIFFFHFDLVPLILISVVVYLICYILLWISYIILEKKIFYQSNWKRIPINTSTTPVHCMSARLNRTVIIFKF